MRLGSLLYGNVVAEDEAMYWASETAMLSFAKEPTVKWFLALFHPGL